MAKKGGSMLTIVILNYNGWEDTIACLESLKCQNYTDYRVVVADNGSSDGSVSHFIEWATLHQTAHIVLEEGESAEREEWLTILRLSHNYGFARGNNLAIQAMHSLPTDYWMCLNNDTIVTQECLSRLVEYADNTPDVEALTPAIRLHAQPDIMWNAGGRLVFGGRRYYCCMKPASTLHGKHVLDITFVTGCALMVRPALVESGRLFTERFFFGEEDYEFSLLMKQQGRRMVCVLDAVIYHKVSASIKQITSYNKLFIHSLNRLINLRQHYSTVKYKILETLFYPYIRWRFLRKMTYRERQKFLSLLRNESRNNEGVNFELFNHYINYSFKDA